MVRPTDGFPVWANLTLTLPLAQIPNKIQPRPILRDQGFDQEALPLAEEENHWRNSVYRWIEHFDITLMGDIDAATLDGLNGNEYWRRVDNVNAATLNNLADTDFWQRTDDVDAATLDGESPAFYRNALTLDGQPAAFYRDAATLDGEQPSFYKDADLFDGQPPSFYLNTAPIDGGDADTLDGIDSTGFWQRTDVVDAGLLNGQPASFYLNQSPVDGGNAARLGGQLPAFYLNINSTLNADTLDGIDSTEFLREGDFPTLLSQTGYQRLTNGLIIQWGRIEGLVPANNGSAVVVFPLAFPSGPFAITINESSQEGSIRNVNISTGNWSNTNFAAFAESSEARHLTPFSPSWIAIGA